MLAARPTRSVIAKDPFHEVTRYLVWLCQKIPFISSHVEANDAVVDDDDVVARRGING